MIKRLINPLLAVALLLFAGLAGADVFKPAYLQLTQVDQNTYDVMWKLPALDESTSLKLKPRFPEGTQNLNQPQTAYAGGMSVQRWRISLPGGLNGKDVAIDGLAETRTDAIVRVERLDGSEQVGRLLPSGEAFRVMPSPGPLEVAQTYTVIGIEHILLGFDHLLFVDLPLSLSYPLFLGQTFLVNVDYNFVGIFKEIGNLYVCLMKLRTP